MRLVLRVVAGVSGLGIWGWGIVRFVDGDQLWGGALVLAGGALIALGLSRGLEDFLRGLADWLYFR